MLLPTESQPPKSKTWKGTAAARVCLSLSIPASPPLPPPRARCLGEVLVLWCWFRNCGRIWFVKDV